MRERKTGRQVLEAVAQARAGEFERLLQTRQGSTTPGLRPADAVVLGTLVAFQDNGATPFVTYADQPGVAPLAARSTIDLLATHIGHPVVLMFEGHDPARPIVLGVVRQGASPVLSEVGGGIEVEADGQRLVVTAERGLVLRCGKASITLTPDGKVVVKGTQIVTHASGLNRIRGGAVQVN
jgi:hypothetical protein